MSRLPKALQKPAPQPKQAPAPVQEEPKLDDSILSEEERRNMSQGDGGQLNPTWVEWLMGFPLGWTDLNASEMP